jgi:hypothetical protein
MLEKCQKYAVAINAKGNAFPTEPLIMALLLEQHKMINWLQKRYPLLSKDSFNVHKIYNLHRKETLPRITPTKLFSAFG